MAITSFDIQNARAVSRASCPAVPRIMIIAGPNGIGKSTLLHALSQRQGLQIDRPTTVLYVPPHRAIRATTVQRRWLFGGPMKWLMDVLGRGDVSGYDGLSIQMPQRTPENVDESGSTIKYSLGRLEDRFQAAIAARVQREKQEGATRHFDLDIIPDIYQPLKAFTQYLLPHLEFFKIDLSNHDQVRCLWKRHGGADDVVLDIDQLSSGEKSMITLFLPLLETEISTLLNQIDDVPGPTRELDVLMLIDEPEQHLHPDLQARVMNYLRKTAGSARTQFIVSTHSPTILDQAFDDELYVMVPPGNDPAENQLKRVATNLERLEALRQLTGNTFVATTGRPVVCIEGERAEVTEPSDIALLELMLPRATAYTFVPVGSKGSVINTVRRLRESLPLEMFKIHVFGITDQDQGPVEDVGISSWPVCMIENYLCHAALIASVLAALAPEREWTEVQVEGLLQEIVDELKPDEIALRLRRHVRSATIRVRGGTPAEVVESLNSQLAPFDGLRANPDQVQAHLDTATQEVDQICADGNALTLFRGKQILLKLYRRVWPTGIVGYSTFVIELARMAAEREEVVRSLDDVFVHLEESILPVAAPPDPV
jgi:energy-coupling factor transporter ATP-binding protein EcfA2